MTTEVPKEMTVEEKQLEFLKRQWTIIDKLIDQQIRFPLFISGGLIAFTSIVIKVTPGIIFPGQGKFFMIVILLFSVISLLTYRFIQQQFNFCYARISHLYDVLGFRGKEFVPSIRSESEVNAASLQRGGMVFLLGYAGILTTATVCAIAIWRILML